MITLLDSDFNRLGNIPGIVDAKRVESLNGDDTLDFQVIFSDKDIVLRIDKNSTFELAGQFFDLASYEATYTEDGLAVINVEAEHISYRLNREEYNLEDVDLTLPPVALLSELLTADVNPGFNIGRIEIDYYDEIEFKKSGSTSRRKLLLSLVETLNNLDPDTPPYVLYFDNFTANVVRRRSVNDAVQVIVGRNIKSLSKTIDNRTLTSGGEPTTGVTCQPVYRPSDSYELGDMVLVLDPVLGIRETMQVVKIESNPHDVSATVITLDTPLRTLSDEISDLRDDVDDLQDEVDDIRDEVDDINDKITDINITGAGLIIVDHVPTDPETEPFEDDTVWGVLDPENINRIFGESAFQMSKRLGKIPQDMTEEEFAEMQRGHSAAEVAIAGGYQGNEESYNEKLVKVPALVQNVSDLTDALRDVINLISREELIP